MIKDFKQEARGENSDSGSHDLSDELSVDEWRTIVRKYLGIKKIYTTRSKKIISKKNK